MATDRNFTRRQFLKASAAGLSFMYLPGIGRVKAAPFGLLNPGDHYGRLCYNENPLGPSPMALNAMQQAAPEANRYPDWYSSTLESQIADHHGLQQNNICAGTGATEIIRLIADAFLSAGDEMVTPTPTYFQMAYEATANGASVVYVPVDEHFTIDLNTVRQAITQNTRLISIVNPNNPQGTIIKKEKLERFINSLPDGVVVVVDEAYHHYIHTSDYESCVRLISEGKPVIIVRTFSKAYGLAGARIGYSVASGSYTSHIASSQNFGMVSNVSQAAAQAALDDQQHVDETVQLNDQAKQILENGCDDLNLEYIPSHTNFMMIKVGNGASVASQLASRGFQVRTGWGMSEYIRVSTGTISEMNGFINALGDILSPGSDDGGSSRSALGLNAIYPNPFTSHCTVTLTTFGHEKVFLTIYDTSGRKVNTLVSEKLVPGTHNYTWDGRDVHGNKVASGIYIINLLQGEFAESMRVTHVR